MEDQTFRVVPSRKEFFGFNWTQGKNERKVKVWSSRRPDFHFPLSGYFSRTWFKCNNMVVKTPLYCTRKCGCKCSIMSACSWLQPPCNGSTCQVPRTELLKTIAIHRNTHVHLLAGRIPSQDIPWFGKIATLILVGCGGWVGGSVGLLLACPVQIFGRPIHH